MNRVHFTKSLCKLLAAMFLDEEQPILDYLKRSPEEQNRLFKEGKSKCDGYEKVSRHQSGKAADIYFLNEDCSGLADPIRGWEYWHNYWEKLGGRPMIIWDKGHFEG